MVWVYTLEEVFKFILTLVHSGKFRKDQQNVFTLLGCQMGCHNGKPPPLTPMGSITNTPELCIMVIQP